MSKKTIYSEYSNREELLRDYIMNHLESIEPQIETTLGSAKDAADKLLNFLLIILTKLLPKLVPLLPDIKLLYPETWKVIENFRSGVLIRLTGLFRELEKDKLINPGVRADTFAYILLSIIQSTIQPEFINNARFSARELILSFIRIIFQGGFHDSLKSKVEELMKQFEYQEVLI